MVNWEIVAFWVIQVAGWHALSAKQPIFAIALFVMSMVIGMSVILKSLRKGDGQ